MKDQSLGLKIFVWVEVVAAARVLLFTAPVLISKCLEQSWNSKIGSDWYILILTFTAVLFFLSGVAAIASVRAWKLLHYIVALLTLGLTGAFIKMMADQSQSITLAHTIPAAVALVIALIIVLAKPKRTTV